MKIPYVVGIVMAVSALSHLHAQTIATPKSDRLPLRTCFAGSPKSIAEFLVPSLQSDVRFAAKNYMNYLN